MARPLAIDLFCGLGGWAEGFLAEGWDVIGFDIERHDYGTGGYPGQLVLQDVTTLHGRQFRDAAVIVASPPCQFFSYTAMPWSRAKALAAEVRSDPAKLEKELALFRACFRIAEQGGVPLVVENVVGAQSWVGRAAWHYGSYYLWGDVPALMPSVKATKNDGGSWFADGRKCPGLNWSGSDKSGYKARAFNTTAEQRTNGTKGSDGYERNHPNAMGWKKPGTSSHSPRRKVASARIAKIPFPLAQHIARVYKP